MSPVVFEGLRYRGLTPKWHSVLGASFSGGYFRGCLFLGRGRGGDWDPFGGFFVCTEMTELITCEEGAVYLEEVAMVFFCCCSGSGCSFAKFQIQYPLGRCVGNRLCSIPPRPHAQNTVCLAMVLCSGRESAYARQAGLLLAGLMGAS